MESNVFVGFNTTVENDVALRKIAAERRIDKTAVLNEAINAYLAANAHEPGIERAVSNTIDWLLKGDFGLEEAKAAIVGHMRAACRECER